MKYSQTLLAVIIFLTAEFAAQRYKKCDEGNFRRIASKSDDYLIYGITQDCQMFFLVPSQLHLLSELRLNRRQSFCYPNLVQLHIKTHDTLILTFKQATNRICTLEVHIPTVDMLFGDHLFRYSLLNSLPYASCSHSVDLFFQLEPDLSFLDPVYNNVLYMVNSMSFGKQWNIRQFLIKDSGILSLMNNLTVDNNYPKEDIPASEFILSIDASREKLYRRHRFDRIVDYQCLYNMLFSKAKPDHAQFKAPEAVYGTSQTSLSADGNILIYTETDRTSVNPVTRLNVLRINDSSTSACVIQSQTTFDAHIVRLDVLLKLQQQPFPNFAEKMTLNPRSTTEQTIEIEIGKADDEEKPEQITTTTKSPLKYLTTPRSSPSSTPSLSASFFVTQSDRSTAKKSTYSPSRSFFEYETKSTTTARTIRENDNDEDYSEIVKELETDKEGIGEMRTINNEPDKSSEQQNLTANHQQQSLALNGGRSYLCAIVSFLFLLFQ